MKKSRFTEEQIAYALRLAEGGTPVTCSPQGVPIESQWSPFSEEGTDIRKSRFDDEQIVGFLRQAEADVAVKELCRQNGFSDATFYKWHARFGGMQAGEAKRLRENEAENAKLKKLLAEAHLHIEALKVGFGVKLSG